MAQIPPVQLQPVTAYKPQQKQISQPLFGAATTGSPKSPAKKAFSLVKWLGGVTALAGGLLWPGMHDVNPPGTASLRVYPNSGVSPEVQGPGLVILWPPYLTDNRQYSMTRQTVVEKLQPQGKGGVKMDSVEIELSFEIIPEKLYDIHTTKTGNKKLTPQENSTTTFSSQDPVTQLLYVQEILPLLRGAVNKLGPKFQEESFHKARVELEYFLNHGFEGTIQDQFVSIEPLAKQFEDHGLKLHFVRVGDMDLPNSMEEDLRTKAQIPLKTEIQGLRQLLSAEQTKADREFAKISAGEAEETALGQAAIVVETERGKLEVAKVEAKKALIQADGQAQINLLEAQAQAEVAYWDSKGEADAVIITAEGDKLATIEKSEGAKAAKIMLGEAAAQAAQAEGKPLKEFPVLLEKAQILADTAARKALAQNAEIMIVKPGTVDLKVMNLGGGTQGALDIRKHLLGEAAADELIRETKKAPAVEAPKKESPAPQTPAPAATEPPPAQ